MESGDNKSEVQNVKMLCYILGGWGEYNNWVQTPKYGETSGMMVGIYL